MASRALIFPWHPVIEHTLREGHPLLSKRITILIVVSFSHLSLVPIACTPRHSEGALAAASRALIFPRRLVIEHTLRKGHSLLRKRNTILIVVSFSHLFLAPIARVLRH